MAVKNHTELLPQRKMVNNQSGDDIWMLFTRGRIIGKLEEGCSVTSQKKQAADSPEKSLDTTQATGRPISRFTVARRLHGGGLFASTPCTVCTFNACPSEKAFSVVPGTLELRDNEWGRVLFTDESRSQFE
ncbi:hypothetical protein TNCV_4178621 [Trichonephila clavipes]|nr:hypothetical protein TNCV_4178621 [Trichonephila clavipes]